MISGSNVESFLPAVDQSNQSAVYELSVKATVSSNTKITSKPQKLRPLKKQGNNLAVSLLENDNKAYEIEGLTSNADLDKEIKDYLDANKIFKQLKSAFNPLDTLTSPTTAGLTQSIDFHKSGSLKKPSTLEPI
jgi:hypothetical protein